MKRIRHNWFSIISVIALLFAQFTVSAYACPMAANWVTEAGKVSLQEPHPDGAADADSPNLCLAHCHGDAANVDQSQPPLIPDAVLISLVPLANAPCTATIPIRIAPDLRHSIHPPPWLRFSVLRI